MSHTLDQKPIRIFGGTHNEKNVHYPETYASRVARSVWIKIIRIFLFFFVRVLFRSSLPSTPRRFHTNEYWMDKYFFFLIILFCGFAANASFKCVIVMFHKLCIKLHWIYILNIYIFWSSKKVKESEMVTILFEFGYVNKKKNQSS